MCTFAYSRYLVSYLGSIGCLDRVSVLVKLSPIFSTLQVEDTKQEGQEEKEKDDKEEGENIPEEKEGIEMNDDFDGM